MTPFEFTPPEERQPQPVRRKWTTVRMLDANGQPYEQLVHRYTVSLSPEGAIDEEACLNEAFYHCGHSRQDRIGGQCAEEGCFRVSCVRCFTRCSQCQVGLCLFHVRYLETALGHQLPVCAHCRDVLRRRRFWRGFWATVLRPFVTFDETND